MPRQSVDKRNENKFGLILPSVCKTHIIQMLNCRSPKDISDKYTYCSPTGSSVVCYMLISTNCAQNVTVDNLDESDHFPISAVLALIHSHFVCRIIAWGNTNDSILKRLFTLQRRSIHVLDNIHYNRHTEPKVNSSGILNLLDLLVYQYLMFISDYLLNKHPPLFAISD